MKIQNLENKWIVVGHIRPTTTVPQPGGLLSWAAQVAEATQLHDTSCALKAWSPRTARPRWREWWGLPDGWAMARRMEWAPLCYGRPVGQEVGGRDLPEERHHVEVALRPGVAAGALWQSLVAEVSSYNSRRSKRLSGARWFEEKGAQNGAHDEGNEPRWRFDPAPSDGFGQEDKGGSVGVACGPWKGEKETREKTRWWEMSGTF
jgi:hypothetical protein